jgi:hypothetical protein
MCQLAHVKSFHRSHRPNRCTLANGILHQQRACRNALFSCLGLSQRFEYKPYTYHYTSRAWCS